MNIKTKNTKIVATLSDLRCDVDFIQKLFDAGMDVVRLNTAHQDEEGTLRVINNVRAVSDKIAIMLDTKGPEIRTCFLENPLLIVKDKEYVFSGNVSASLDNHIPTTYEGIVSDVPLNATILVDDGYVAFKVIKKDSSGLHTVALNNGEVKNKKSINIPNISINLPALTEKDKSFIRFAARNNLDFIAHSFVRNKNDVNEVQKILDEEGSSIGIISKIENKEGVDNIQEIIDESYGVMIARGDLAIEIPAAQIPLLQKEIIQKCLQSAKPVIVATQMLESMIKQPRPTRAEVSDVANAIIDGASAIMLSGETAYGDYPIEAVQTMSDVALDLHNRKAKICTAQLHLAQRGISSEIAILAAELATKVSAKAVIVPSITGKTARVISAIRTRKPIFALCYDESTMRKLALSHGIRAGKIAEFHSTDELVSGCITHLVDNGSLTSTDLVVFLGGTVRGKPHRTNFLEVAVVSDILEEYK